MKVTVLIVQQKVWISINPISLEYIIVAKLTIWFFTMNAYLDLQRFCVYSFNVDCWYNHGNIPTSKQDVHLPKNTSMELKYRSFYPRTLCVVHEIRLYSTYTDH